MSINESKSWTVELYKSDKRRKTGRKMIDSFDVEGQQAAEIEGRIAVERGDADSYEVHKTFIEKFNIMSREPYLEHYTTPRCCSPASELYWCM